MADLTQTELSHEWSLSQPESPTRYMILEIRRHRAAQAADFERIREVVEKIAASRLGPNFVMAGGWSQVAHDIANRAAEQLATPRRVVPPAELRADAANPQEARVIDALIKSGQ